MSEGSTSQRKLAQAAQRGCRCSVPGGVQDQVGWGPGQPGLVPDLEVGSPACGKGLRTCSSLRLLPTQAILWILWLLINNGNSTAATEATQIQDQMVYPSPPEVISRVHRSLCYLPYNADSAKRGIFHQWSLRHKEGDFQSNRSNFYWMRD